MLQLQFALSQNSTHVSSHAVRAGTVMVVVFTGAGDRAFSAGGNLATGEASGGMRGESGSEK
jgi:enoyl-CoA hydratase/carnithine racemase